MVWLDVVLTGAWLLVVADVAAKVVVLHRLQEIDGLNGTAKHDQAKSERSAIVFLDDDSSKSVRAEAAQCL